MRIVTPAAGFLDTREVHKFAGRVRATGDAGFGLPDFMPARDCECSPAGAGGFRRIRFLSRVSRRNVKFDRAELGHGKHCP